MVSQDWSGSGNGSHAGFPPAPVDPDGLAAAVRPFGESRMLPPAAYTSTRVFAWERQHFFGGGWSCVAHASRLPEAGAQLAVETGNGGANTCRHRGHELLPCGSAATGKAIVCPYHSWAFSLSGELRGAPGFRYTAGFDPAAWSLIALPAAEWHGLVPRVLPLPRDSPGAVRGIAAAQRGELPRLRLLDRRLDVAQGRRRDDVA